MVPISGDSISYREHQSEVVGVTSVGITVMSVTVAVDGDGVTAGVEVWAVVSITVGVRVPMAEQEEPTSPVEDVLTTM